MATRPILTLPGKVNASNALVVTGAATAAQGPATPIANLKGDVDGSHRLVVEFV